MLDRAGGGDQTNRMVLLKRVDRSGNQRAEATKPRGGWDRRRGPIPRFRTSAPADRWG